MGLGSSPLPGDGKTDIGSQTNSGGARVHNGPSYVWNNLGARNEHDEIREWLLPIDFAATHERIRRDLDLGAPSKSRLQKEGVEYAGKWVLESHLFKEWLRPSSDKDRLWYCGRPGAGKTALASIIISHLQILHLQSNQENRPPKIAFVYFNFKEEHSIEQILGSIIGQLLEHDNPLPESLVKHWSQRSRGRHPALQRELSDIMFDIIEKQQTFVIVDALDEGSLETRSQLLKIFDTEPSKLRLLVTSRSLENGTTLSRGFEKMEFGASPSDLGLYIENRFEEWCHKKRPKRKEELLDHVKSVIITRCEGIFLLAKLQMAALVSELNPGQFRRRVETLPTKLDGMYEQILSRINNTSTVSRTLALSVLLWITFSGRSMSLIELQHALAVKVGCGKLDDEEIYHPDVLREVCHGLVTIPPQDTDIVTLLHDTARDFLSRRKDQLFPDCQMQIAQTCIAYLSLEELEGCEYAESESDQGHPVSRQNSLRLETPYPKGSNSTTFTDEWLAKYPFVSYAAGYFDHHLRQTSNGDSQDSTAKRLGLLLCENRKRNFLCRAMFGRSPNKREYPFIPKILTQRYAKRPLAVARNQTLSNDDSYQEESELDSADEAYQQSTGKSSTVELRPTGVSPWHLAAFIGWMPIIDALLATERNGKERIDSLDHYWQPPLTVAIAMSHWDFVAGLLKLGVTVDLLSEAGHCVLLYAVQEENGREAVRRLIMSNLEPLEDGYWPSERFEANKLNIFADHRELKRALRQPALSMNTTGCSMTADLGDTIRESFRAHLQLLLAAFSGNAEVVRNLVSTGSVDVKETDIAFHITALFLATELCQASIVKELLSSGADVRMRGIYGHTLLHRAAVRNSLELARILVEAGAEVDARDSKDRTTPLDCTWDMDVARFLCSCGADPNVRDESGVSRLYRCAAGGHIGELSFLLDLGVNPTIRTNYGWTPLHWAANNGFIQCVKALLEKKADPNAVSDQRKTPLDMARKSGQYAIEELLLRANAKTEKEIESDGTLWRMARYGPVEATKRRQLHG
ncbi:ankyrin repeat protein [Colletotrichum asianum]|uniref:Ankyrin repeat protein n=1 Tax=Colletotrichum asianum TaxID=702518 RepID=A0A8H3ZQW0_9PEZI|nr:ankyrin repeat protein [Colletotrichum asianum]